MPVRNGPNIFRKKLAHNMPDFGHFVRISGSGFLIRAVPQSKFLLAKLKAWSLKTGSVMLFSTHLVSLSTSTFLASCYDSFQIWLPSLENNIFPAAHCQWKSGDAGWVIFQHERRGPNHFFSSLSCGQDHRPNFPSHAVTDSDSECCFLETSKMGHPWLQSSNKVWKF